MIGSARQAHLRSVLLRALPSLLILAAAAGAVPLGRAGRFTSSDWLYAVLLAGHAGVGAALLACAGSPRRPGRSPRPFLFLLFRSPEILFTAGLVLFVFAYIFASNANMDYVQRFIASGGNLRLAPDSAKERLAAWLRYAPLLAGDLLLIVVPRLAMRGLARFALGSSSFPRLWALPLSLASALSYSLSLPSFVSTDGIPALAFVCLVPLLVVLFDNRPGWGTFYGVVAGAVQTMITNFWLGTFNLLTLQFVTVVTTLQYVLFMIAGTRLARRSGSLGFLVFPAAWVLFDWLRSLGFLGYPWGMLGTSLYAAAPLIQVSSITGVWGVTFFVTLFSSVAAWCLLRAARRQPVPRAPLAALACVLAAVLGWGGLRLLQERPGPGGAAQGAPPEGTVRLALVQQNADPRKDDYEEVYRTLKRLTESALAARPDMVVWSETAFVPNIRRWGAMKPADHPYARLVHEFLGWQQSIGTWLVTGNDDYETVESSAGVQRKDYNGAVLFSPRGERTATYHKIHLVPFTESFPYREQLPAIYRLLQSFDAYLWEPGRQRVVFRHPRLAFSTPICFEDAFPGDVRRFVREGAEAIVNLSNDYWSQTEAEAMQHAANSVFRAVENARPLVRASASGLTCSVDTRGRIRARGPIYEEAVLTVDIAPGRGAETLYTRWGDWFPPACAALLAAALGAGIVRSRRRRS
jgi:apolipoprotein N-acyltransferase